ncbi:MAG: ImmA/IrrE family metallo-endopeptidase [Phycisphaerae bacterium]|nr:ImmA/IrrE family metallo-endopeptidase [Phycisphaerae bacterium]
MTDYIARNVRRLRALKGLNQGEIADKAGISRNAYRAIETGAAEPRVSNLQKIADALDVSIMDLVREVPQLESLRFRSQKTLTAQQRAEREDIATRVSLWLRDFNELEDMLGVREAPAISESNVVGKEPQAVAQSARKRLKLHPECPVADICDVLDRAGIKVYQAPSRLEKYFGLSVGEKDKGPAIAVNTSKSIPVEKRIFSAAHELGHLIMHQASYDGSDRLEDDREEKEANAFAGYFLMPEDAFGRVWNSDRGLHFVDRVMKAKCHFQVSYAVVLYRLMEVQEVGSSIWADFRTYFRQRFGKPLPIKAEPFPLPEPEFKEGKLDLLVREALEKSLISIGRAAEILEVSLEQMRTRIASWSLAH